MSIASSSNAAYLPHAGSVSKVTGARRITSEAAARLLKILGGLLVSLILPLLLLALWQVAVEKRWLAEQILPAPAFVWQSFIDLWDSGDLLTNLAISLKRFGWSLLFGGSAGLALGVVMGVSRSARAYLYPSFEIVSQFPVVGWIPLLIIFTGIGEALKISAISIAVVVPVAVNTYKGIGNIPSALLDVAKVYRFSFAQVVLRVVLPAASPGIFNGIRQGVMQAWLSLVFVELLASSEGIGYLIVWGRQLLQLDIVIVGMVVISVIGIALDRALHLIEVRLQGWQRQAF